MVYNMCKKIKSVFVALIFIISILLFLNHKTNLNKKEQEEKALSEFFINDIKVNNNTLQKTKNEKINYIAVLEIPSISLKRGLVSFDNKFNNVNYNIEILNDSLNESDDGNIYLAAHSGNSEVSYFKNLYKVNISDDVYLYYNGTKYKFIVDEIYEENKNGSILVEQDNTKKLIMTTCSKEKSKQLIVVCVLIDKIR